MLYWVINKNWGILASSVSFYVNLLGVGLCLMSEVAIGASDFEFLWFSCFLEWKFR